MRKILAAFAAVLVSGAAVVANAGVADASTQLTAACGAGGGDYSLHASVWYTTPSSTTHHWTGSSFRLYGNHRNENNLDMWVYAGGKVYAHRGAGNIAGEFTYTSTAYPDFALNVDTPSYLADEHVSFIAVFDKGGSGDPSCPAYTSNI